MGLKWQAQEFVQSAEMALDWCMKVGDVSEPLEPLAMSVFCIFLEMLSNLGRHARAHLLNVHIALRQAVLRLTMWDHCAGTAFDLLTETIRVLISDDHRIVRESLTQTLAGALDVQVVAEAVLLANRILLMSNGSEGQHGYAPDDLAEVISSPLPRQRARARLHHLDGNQERVAGRRTRCCRSK